MRYALCAMRDVETNMPAIASLEDLKAAQKDLHEARDVDELKLALKEVTQSSLLSTDEGWCVIEAVTNTDTALIRVRVDEISGRKNKS